MSRPPLDGPALERVMTERLHGKGIRLESIPGGSRLYGFPSQSGLAHQLERCRGPLARIPDVQTEAHAPISPFLMLGRREFTFPGPPMTI